MYFSLYCFNMKRPKRHFNINDNKNGYNGIIYFVHL